MHIVDQKPVEMLNSLIGIINERIEGCNYASNEVDAGIFKILFARLSKTSEQCREELIKEVQKLGGKPLGVPAGPRECFRAWMDVISAIGRNDHRAILDSFIYEENVVLRTYSEILSEEEEINSQQQKLLHRHYFLIKEDEEKIKNLLSVLNSAA